jgi:hypothetical protein
MRQDSEKNPKGTNRAAPPSSAQLTKLASDLAGVHPSDLNQLLQVITQFGWQLHPEDRDAPFPPAEPLDGIRKIIEMSRTLWLVHPSEVKGEGFAGFIGECGRLLELAQAYFASISFASSGFASIEASAVCAQLDRIAASLAGHNAAVITLPSRQLIRDKVVIAAAIALGLLVWDITSDDLMLWQIISALGLVAVICGATFRIGQRSQIQTSGTTSRVVVGKGPERTLGR